MKTWITIFFFMLLPLLSLAQLNTYSANELDSLQYAEKRPVLFFVNTDWCSICLAMENKVLKSEAVSKELNENYYLVILNAESKEDIVYKRKRYVYEASGINEGKHQLAMKLARKDGTVSFPSTVIILGNETVFKNNSFMSEKDLINVLTLLNEKLKE